MPTWCLLQEPMRYRMRNSVDTIQPASHVHAHMVPTMLQEAIPYAEFLTNPFLMLATTPTGGHLGWLPLGGKFQVRMDVDLL